MNFRQLEIFRAVVLSGSASRASELLDISQPAVSRSLADLETALGFQLFDRVRGRLVTTPEGELFFKEVVESFTVFDRLRSSAERIRDFGSGVIKIASLAALGSTVVPRGIGLFSRSYPEIAVTLQVLSSHAVYDLVSSSQYDVGLVADEVDLTGIGHQVFGSFRAVCAVPPGSPLATREVVTVEDLHKQSFIALAPGDSVRSALAEICSRQGVQPSIVVETPNSATVCALVLEGVGIGILNPMAIDGFPERGLILKPFVPNLQFRSYLIFRPDAQKSKIVKAMVDALLQARSLRATTSRLRPDGKPPRPPAERGGEDSVL